MPVLNALNAPNSHRAGDPYAALKQALTDARSSWYHPAGNTFDYRGFGASAEFQALAGATSGLVDFAVERLGVGKRLPFWLNVYNALVLQAVVVRVPAGGARLSEDFFVQSKFVTGGHEFSLDDIEHGLMRGNAPRFRALRRQMPEGDRRLACAPYSIDERVHFAMHSACRASPRLRVFGKDTLDSALEDAACDYVREHVRLEERGAVLCLPRLFQWYAGDFDGEDGVRAFVINRLAREEDVEALDRRGGRCAIRYLDFDWTLNQR